MLDKIKLYIDKERINRAEYIITQLIIITLTILILYLASFGILNKIIVPLVVLLAFSVNLIQTVKRLRDFHASPWLTLILLTPIAPFFILALCFIKGVN